MWAIYTTISSISAAFTSIIQKQTLKHIHAVQLMTTTYLYAALLSLLFIPFVNLSLSLRSGSLIFVACIIQVFAYIFSVKAMRRLDVSIVAPFYNLGTAFSAILGVIIFKENLSFIAIAGIFLLIAGGYILELKSKNLLQPIKDVVKSKCIHELILGVMLFSISFVLIKYILMDISPISFLFFQTMTCAVLFTLISFIFYKGFKDIEICIRKENFLIMLFSVLLLSENILLNLALKDGEVSLVVPLYRTWTLWAVIFGGRFFHENHLAKRAIASILMIGGAALILIW